jgi:hypothetical protein
MTPTPLILESVWAHHKKQRVRPAFALAFSFSVLDIILLSTLLAIEQA